MKIVPEDKSAKRRLAREVLTDADLMRVTAREQAKEQSFCRPCWAQRLMFLAYRQPGLRSCAAVSEEEPLSCYRMGTPTISPA
jgi:hypothetical protein